MGRTGRIGSGLAADATPLKSTHCVRRRGRTVTTASSDPAMNAGARHTALTTGNVGERHPEPLVLFSMSPRETGADHLVRVAEWQTR